MYHFYGYNSIFIQIYVKKSNGLREDAFMSVYLKM